MGGGKWGRTCFAPTVSPTTHSTFPLNCSCSVEYIFTFASMFNIHDIVPFLKTDINKYIYISKLFLFYRAWENFHSSKYILVSAPKDMHDSMSQLFEIIFMLIIYSSTKHKQCLPSGKEFVALSLNGCEWNQNSNTAEPLEQQKLHNLHRKSKYMQTFKKWNCCHRFHWKTPNV